ncbi:hypothetical protein QTP88_010235 [Uroleucon formosanum]
MQQAKEIEIIETTKGKPLAIFNGYQFRKYRQNENGTVWVCLNEKKYKCTGRMRTKNLEIINFSDHLCKPDVAASESSYTSSSQIFRQEISPLFQKGYDHVTNIPTYAYAKTTLNRIKKRTLGNTLNPNSKEEIIIPDDISQFGNNYQFVLFDDDVEERIIAFSSSHIPNFNPNIITIDFEAATIQVIKDVFPNIQISGCNYQFNQSLWRKVQNVGLVDEYRDNEEIRLNIRMCSALALITLQDIDEGWLIIMESNPNNEKLKLFHDYFVEQWLENEIMSKNIWNCYQKRHRTNNVVEGWNSRLNKQINRPRPTFLALYKCLKLEAELGDLLFNRHFLNLEGKKRKKCYMELDIRIDKTLKSYEEDRDLKKCLKILSFVQ